MDKSEFKKIRTTAGDELLIKDRMPVLAVRDAVVFPGMTIPLAIGRPASLAALDAAKKDGLLVIATQRDPAVEEPGLSDLYSAACITRIVRVVDTRGDGKQAVVVGVQRVKITESSQQEILLSVHITPTLEPDSWTPDSEDARNQVLALANRVIDLREDYPESWKDGLEKLSNASLLADLIASNLPLSIQERIEFLEEGDPKVRLTALLKHLEREVTIAETQQSLQAKDDEEMSPHLRERLLRKQMRDLEDEIGEADTAQREVDELRERLEQAMLPKEALEHTDRELKRLSALPAHAPDRHLIRTYLESIADLPWSIETTDQLDLKSAQDILDEDHYGLEKVKERIIEYLAVRKLAPAAKAPILCFVGPPGVGKTSLGRSIARVLGRKLARASLGGVRDEAEIRGHRRTYVGAMPGRILQSLRRAGSRNPVFLLDEIDKLGSDFRGDPSSALLEVLDPEQNHMFSDHYLEIPFDLSKILFIATANTLATIPGALLDRMEVIELPGYTEADKISIAHQHLVPKQMDAHGLDQNHIEILPDALETVVLEYTREAGVRNLERHLASLMRKVAAKIASKSLDARISVDKHFVAKSLGAPPHLPESAERTSKSGVAVGLAATSHGGDILFIEATAMPGGKGVRLHLTGQLGDVMRESAETALSWVRANANELDLTSPSLDAGEIHVHVPAGAVPKDGPSAGIALATAITSVLSGRKSLGTLALTGELSLRGRVLPVGGIKDKLMAARRAGIDTVLIPRRNEKDLVEVPQEVRDQLQIHCVESMTEVLERALLR